MCANIVQQLIDLNMSACILVNVQKQSLRLLLLLRLILLLLLLAPPSLPFFLLRVSVQAKLLPANWTRPTPEI